MAEQVLPQTNQYTLFHMKPEAKKSLIHLRVFGNAYLFSDC